MFRKRSWLASVTHRRVLVHTVEDQTFDGVLTGAHDDGLVLANAKFLAPDIGLAGEIWMPRSKVRFVQLIPPEGS